MKKQAFDERQLWIRGNIYKHGCILLIILLFVNAFLAGNDIFWADSFYTNIILAFIPITICSIELIFQDIYYQTPTQRTFLLIIFSVMGIISLISHVKHLIHGEPLLSDGQLTQNGGSFVICILILIIAISLGIKTILDKTEKISE